MNLTFTVLPAHGRHKMDILLPRVFNIISKKFLSFIKCSEEQAVVLDFRGTNKSCRQSESELLEAKSKTLSYRPNDLMHLFNFSSL